MLPQSVAAMRAGKRANNNNNNNNDANIIISWWKLNKDLPTTCSAQAKRAPASAKLAG